MPCHAMTVVLIGVSALFFPGPKASPKPQRVTIEELVTSAPLPEGYGVTHNEIKDGETLLGHQLVFTKEGVVSKVVATVEERNLPDKDYKMAALKGYVNGTTKSLVGAGLKEVKKDIPDIKRININKRTKCSFVYQNAEGGDIYVQIQVFFTNVGYNILVVGDNEHDYKLLAKWAETIQPLKKDAKKK